MSSARRSAAHQSAELRRKQQGRLAKGAALAAASGAGANNASNKGDSDARTVSEGPTLAAIELPATLPTLWNWSSSGSGSEVATGSVLLSTPGDRACAAACTALLHARDTPSQFVRMHGIATAIMDALGVQAKKGKKQAPAAAAATATGAADATPAAPAPSSLLSFPVRQRLMQGLLELLCLKLHIQARNPIYAALEALDAPMMDADSSLDAPVAAASSALPSPPPTLLAATVSAALHRFADPRSPGGCAMAHVIQFEQLLPFKPASLTLAAQVATVLRGITKSIDEIVLRQAASMAGAASPRRDAADGAQEEDEEEEPSAPSSNTATHANQLMSPTDQTRFLLRAAVGYVLRHRAQVQELFAVAQPASVSGAELADNDAAAPHRSDLRQLVQTVTRVLVSPHSHRDVLTQCGLIAALLMHLSCAVGPVVRSGADTVDRLMARAIHATYFAPPGVPIDTQLLLAVPALEWMHTATRAAGDTSAPTTRSVDVQLQSLARLACLRSVASHSSLQVLLCPMESPLDSSRSPDSPPDTLLLTHLSPAVFNQCKSINPFIRAYALQTLDVLLLRCKAHLIATVAAGKAESAAAVAAAATGDSSATPVDASRRVQERVLREMELLVGSVMEVLYANFDHPFKAIPGIAKGLFIQYIELRNVFLTMGQTSSTTEEEAQRKKQEYWTNFIGQLLHRESAGAATTGTATAGGVNSTGTGFNTSSRGVFTMLLVLLPLVRVLDLLRSYPSLLESLFLVSQHRALFGLATQVIELILARAKEEGVTAPRLATTATAAVGEEAETEGEGKARSKHKQRKDVNKKRIKDRAAEATLAGSGSGSTTAAATSSDVPPSASSATTTTAAPVEVLSPFYLSQLSHWRSLWTPLVLGALLSPLSLWRSDVASGTLAFILRMLDREPDALGRIVGAIQSATPVASGSESERGESRAATVGYASTKDLSHAQLRALVLVLKIARRIGLISSADLDRKIRRDESATAEGDAGSVDSAAAPSSSSAASSTTATTAVAVDFLPMSSRSLFSALLHTDLPLRLDVFEFLCCNASSAEMLSQLELDLLGRALPYLLKTSLPATRAKVVHGVQKCMMRVRDSVQREVREDLAMQERFKAAGNSVPTVVDSADQPMDPSVAHLSGVLTAPSLARLLPSFRFFARLLHLLTSSLYPAAPFDRSVALLELQAVLLDMTTGGGGSSNLGAVSAASAGGMGNATGWVTNAPVWLQGAQGGAAEVDVWGLKRRMFTAPHTTVLVNLLASNYERVRLLAFELLSRFPTPLPGIGFAPQSQQQPAPADAGSSSSTPLAPLGLGPFLRWSLSLARSARMRDAEGGALALRLIFKKYVVGCGVQVDYERWARMGEGESSAGAESAGFSVAPSVPSAILSFLLSLHSFLRFQLSVLRAAPLATRYSDPLSRLHGTLLVFRSVQGDMPWGGLGGAGAAAAAAAGAGAGAGAGVGVGSGAAAGTMWEQLSASEKSSWRALSESMISTLREVTEVSLSLHIPTNAVKALRGERSTDADGTTPATTAGASSSVTMDCRGHVILPRSSSDGAVPDSTNADAAQRLTDLGSGVGGGDDFADQLGEQMVVVSSWLAVKEVALSLGEWVCTAPLPITASSSAASAADSSLVSASSSSPFSLSALHSLGTLFFAILSCSKHNGVLENSHEGLLAVASSLLHSHDPALVAMVKREWLGHLMGLIADPWTGEGWIRRSRGVAYALLALLQAEPLGTRQTNSEGGHIDGEDVGAGSGDVSSGALGGGGGGDGDAHLSMLDRCMSQLIRMASVDTATVGPVDPVTGLRTQGWKLKVHGLNILRALFRDSALVLGTLPFIAPVLRIAIEGFAHGEWAVRNSSLITFGALLGKAVRSAVRSSVGGGGAGSEEDAAATGTSANNGGGGMTAVDFFTQFPSLHGFLLEQLRQATKDLVTEQPQGEGEGEKASTPANASASEMHPSLYPVLLLLSRLIPSPTDSSSTPLVDSSSSASASASASAAALLDSHAFLPSIRLCSAHPFFQARFMASRAVVALVAIRELRGFLDEIVQALAAAAPKKGEGGAGTRTPVRHNHIHGLLLQMDALLRFHHADGSSLSPADKRSLGAALSAQLLGECRWLSDAAAMRAAPIRLLYLQVLELVVEYAESGASTSVHAAAVTDARRDLLFLAAQSCDMPPMDDASTGSGSGSGSFEGIGVDGLRSEAAGMVVRCICAMDPSALAATGGDFTGLILALLRDGLDSSAGASPSLALVEQLLWSFKRCFALHSARLSLAIDTGALVRFLLAEVIQRFKGDFATSRSTNHSILELAFQIVLDVTQYRKRGGGGQGLGSAESVEVTTHWDALLTYTSGSVDIPCKSAAFQCLSLSLREQLEALRVAAAAVAEASAGAGAGAASSDSVQSLLRAFLQRACTWMELLESFCDDEQPVLLRYACVEAVQHSGLLQAHVQRSTLSLPASDAGVSLVPMLPPPSWSSPNTCPLASLRPCYRSLRALCVRLWTAPLLHLLQDENDSVRIDTGTLVGGVVERGSAAAARDGESESDPRIGSGTLLVSRVLEACFSYLRERFAHEPLLSQSLHEMLRFYTLNYESTFDNASSTKGLMGATTSHANEPASDLAPSPSPSPSPSGSPISSAPLKLFEHEKANAFVEEVLLMELAAHTLARMDAAGGAEQLAGGQDEEEEAVLARLDAWSAGLADGVRSVQQSASASSWVGGETFKEGRFVHLYGHALGMSVALAAARSQTGLSPAGQARLRGTEAALLAALLPAAHVSLHPLLHRALSHVRGLLERTMDPSAPLPLAVLTHLAQAH